MKKYIIFAISFIVIFTIFEVLFGMLLTVTNTPDIQSAWNMTGSASQEVVVESGYTPFLIELLIAFLSASIAYSIPNLFQNKRNQL